jgi:tellurite resistance protein TehA-like permease
MALRIISLLCCMSLQMIPCQIFGIWFLNFILYAAWCIYAMYEMITKEEKDHELSLEFFNTVLLLLIFSTSVCGVIFGIPLFIYKLYERASQDKDSLSRKVGQI